MTVSCFAYEHGGTARMHGPGCDVKTLHGVYLLALQDDPSNKLCRLSIPAGARPRYFQRILPIDEDFRKLVHCLAFEQHGLRYIRAWDPANRKQDDWIEQADEIETI